jgi:hypothetical protein
VKRVTEKQRLDQHDKQTAAIRNVIHEGRRLAVQTRKDIRTLAAAQKKTDESLKAQSTRCISLLRINLLHYPFHPGRNAILDIGCKAPREIGKPEGLAAFIPALLPHAQRWYVAEHIV